MPTDFAFETAEAFERHLEFRSALGVLGLELANGGSSSAFLGGQFATSAAAVGRFSERPWQHSHLHYLRRRFSNSLISRISQNRSGSRVTLPQRQELEIGHAGCGGDDSGGAFRCGTEIGHTRT